MIPTTEYTKLLADAHARVASIQQAVATLGATPGPALDQARLAEAHAQGRLDLLRELNGQ
jgi:hypothetical protein